MNKYYLLSTATLLLTGCSTSITSFMQFYTPSSTCVINNDVINCVWDKTPDSWDNVDPAVFNDKPPSSELGIKLQSSPIVKNHITVRTYRHDVFDARA